jgi:hypothetical protein
MAQTNLDQIIVDCEKDQRKRWRFIFCLVIIFSLLFFFLSIYLICFYAPPLVISPQTTRITGPLTPEGQIDFYRYIDEKYYGNPQIATDDNGFRIFIRTFGVVYDSVNSPPFIIVQKYDKLGLDINTPPTMTMPDSPLKIISDHYAGLGETIQNDHAKKMFSKPWTLEEVPMLAEWIETADKPLDALAEMIRKPIFVCPLLKNKDSSGNSFGDLLLLYETIIPDLETFRTIALLYQARANYRIAKGDIDGTINDTISIYKLERHLGKDIGFFIHLLVSAGLEGFANAIPLNANPNCQLTKEQLQRLLDTINQLPPRTSFSDSCEFDRLDALNAAQALFYDYDTFKRMLPDPDNIAKNFITFLPCNQNVFFNRVNEAYDIIAKKKTGNIEDYFIKSYRTKTFIKRLPTSAGRGMIAADCINSMFIPAIDSVDQTLKRCDCSSNMKLLTLALLIYKSEHGEYPKSDWIEKIKPYLGNDSEKLLHCPAHSTRDNDKTNYALISYDKLPTNKNALLLVELKESIPFEQAIITVDEKFGESELSEFIGKLGSSHQNRINTSRQSGAVRFIENTIYQDESEIKKLIKQTPDTNNDEESKNNFDY